MTTTIVEISPKQSKTGKTYYQAVDTNGVRYSVWDAPVAGTIAAHLHAPLTLDIEEKGNFKTIRQASATQALPFAAPAAVKAEVWPNAQATGSDRDRLILRQVALKAGVEIAATGHDSYDHATIATQAIELAERFNDWLNGRNTSPKPAVPHVAATLKPNQSLAQAVDEVLNEDILPEYPDAPHPATTAEPWMRASGPPRR